MTVKELIEKLQHFTERDDNGNEVAKVAKVDQVVIG